MKNKQKTTVDIYREQLKKLKKIEDAQRKWEKKNDKKSK